jgi:hypothetical protein
MRGTVSMNFSWQHLSHNLPELIPYSFMKLFDKLLIYSLFILFYKFHNIRKVFCRQFNPVINTLSVFMLLLPSESY